MKRTHNWVQCWGLAPARLSLMYFPAGKRTFRLVINTPITGSALRVKLSNKYGEEAASIGAMTVARCNRAGTIPPDARIIPLTYNGDSAFKVYPGQRLATDAVSFDAAVGDFLCVSMLLNF